MVIEWPVLAVLFMLVQQTFQNMTLRAEGFTKLACLLAGARMHGKCPIYAQCTALHCVPPDFTLMTLWQYSFQVANIACKVAYDHNDAYCV